MGEQHGIEHRPQQIELELEDDQRPLLQFTGVEMAEGDAQAVDHVARRFSQATGEVVVAFRFDPWVMRRPIVEAGFVDGRGEQFGQR